MLSNELLYNGGTISCLDTPVDVGTFGPSGLGFHKNHNSGSPAVKYSNIAVAVEQILSGKWRFGVMDVIDTPLSGRYLIAKEEGTSQVCLFHTPSARILRCAISESLMNSYFVQLFGVLLTSFGSGDTFPVLFSKAKTEYDANNGKVKSETMLKICDSFYYEFVKAGSIDTVEFFEATKFAQLQVNYRTQYQSGDIKKLRFSVFSEYPDTLPKEEKKKESPKANKVSEVVSFFQECKNGNYKLDISLSAEQMLHVPAVSYLDDYIPCESFVDAVKNIHRHLSRIKDRSLTLSDIDAILGKDPVNFILLGRPGTGKTKTAYAIGAVFGLPVYTIAVNRHSEEEVFCGMTKAMDGAFQFVETPFLTGHKTGGIVVIEEINMSDDNIAMGSIGQAAEFPYVLMEDGYKPVKRNPFTVYVGTMNTGTYGSIPLQQALASRFPNKYLMDDPDPEVFKEILTLDGYQKANIAKVHRVYTQILKILTNPNSQTSDPEIALCITLRSCRAALDNIADGVSFERAVKNTMINAIAMYDTDLSKQIESLVLH